MFITFEGIEGSGKTTQSKLLFEKLKQLKIPVIYSREPGGCNIGNKLREILLNPENDELDVKTELFLYLASRSQHVKEKIIPALKDNKIVIVDRYNDSTIAYQGFGRGLDVDFLISLCDFSCYGIWPDITVLIDLPVEIGLNRAMGRNYTTNNYIEARFELESIEFHQRVRRGFLNLSERFKKRFVVVDGKKSIDDIFSEIFTILEKRISKSS